MIFIKSNGVFSAVEIIEDEEWQSDEGAVQKKQPRTVTNGSKALAEKGTAERLEASGNRILFYHKQHHCTLASRSHEGC